MNKAVLALSLVMAVTVVSTIGAAAVQFVTAAEGNADDQRNSSDTGKNASQFAAPSPFTDSVPKIIIM